MAGLLDAMRNGHKPSDLEIAMELDEIATRCKRNASGIPIEPVDPVFRLEIFISEFWKLESLLRRQ